MIACSLLRLLLLNLNTVFNHAGLEMQQSNISVKYSEENLGLRERLKDRGISGRNR